VKHNFTHWAIHWQLGNDGVS